MTNFIFPLNSGKVSWNTTKKQAWNVTEYISASGERKALIQQNYPKWTLSLEFPKLCRDEVQQLMSFYARCRGSWMPFFYKDFEDYRCIERKLVKDETGAYQAVIVYGDYEEPAELIDNVAVYVGGIRFDDFDVNGGKILVNTESADVTFDYDYYLKVVFESNISVKQLFEDIYKTNVSLTVVR